MVSDGSRSRGLGLVLLPTSAPGSIAENSGSLYTGCTIVRSGILGTEVKYYTTPNVGSQFHFGTPNSGAVSEGKRGGRAHGI